MLTTIISIINQVSKYQRWLNIYQNKHNNKLHVICNLTSLLIKSDL